MIRLEQVSFSYPNTQIIRNVSFHIEAGEFVALIGANGAGKSTVSKLCNGLLKPSAGQVIVKGLNTRTTRTSQLAKYVGFLFQNPDRQICQNTIRAELMFGLECVVPDPQEREQRCRRTLEEFGFNGDQDPFSMSRGERQRIALASLLTCEPELLLLDEPTTGLDYRECMEIMELMRRLNEKGTTILMVTHDMELVQDFARRVLVLNHGELLGDGDTNQIMKDEALLRRASVLPAQIPALALRLGAGFEAVYHVGEMVSAIESRCV